MLNKFLTLFIVASVLVESAFAGYAYGVDIAQGATVSQFQCIKSSGYSTSFTQIYMSAGSGSPDVTGCQNVINAYTAGLGTEVYINPSPNSNKQGYQQFDEALNQLKSAGINVRTIWLKVSLPINWSNNIQYNTNFIQSVITRARSNGVTLGIYTNFYDWMQITGSSTAFSQYNLPVWYWGIYGYGPSAEGTADFNDFRNFASWNSPSAKTYAMNESCCGVNVGKVAYSAGSKFAELVGAKLTSPLAGSAIL
uniref:Lysozyme n=1 Tax=Rhabditophanes sp. KR3021 TaxID=114890 RepID=A0AC35TIP6_9BILA